MNVDQYSQKRSDYFQHLRTEVVKYLPNGLERVLEVGCGQGHTLDWLKNEHGCLWVAGIEIEHQAASIARDKVDELYEGNIEDMLLPIEEGSLDAVLCPDVLEHLVDPWGVVVKLSRLVKRGGYFIVSVPNVGHFKVLWPLITRGKWEYAEDGILDRTHLRFFTKETAVKLVEGMQVEAIESTGLAPGTKASLLNLLTLGLFRRFFEFQYIITARKR